MDRIIEKKWYYEVGPSRVGPLPWEGLIHAARAGQFGPYSRVMSDGWSDWVPAAQVPGLFPAQPGGALGNDAGTRMLLPVGRAGSAIVAGYLGLFSMLGIFAPFAVIMGVVALRSIKRDPSLHGAGRAWFGIVMGTLFTLLYGGVFLAEALH